MCQIQQPNMSNLLLKHVIFFEVRMKDQRFAHLTLTITLKKNIETQRFSLMPGVLASLRTPLSESKQESSFTVSVAK